MSLKHGYNRHTFYGMLETEVDKESVRSALLPELDLIEETDLRLRWQRLGH